MKPDPKLQGSHKNTVKAGKDCGGKVKDGNCKGCGADFIPPKNIKPARGDKK